MAADNTIESLTKSNPTIKQPYGSQVPTMRRTWDQDLERLNSEYGYKQKLTLLTDNHKLLMYLKDPIISAIVQTRVNQVCTFAVPQEDKYSPGFMWEKKDKTEAVSDDEKATVQMLNDFITNVGIVDGEREEADELMNFCTWLELGVKDALIYSTLVTEIVPDKTNKVHHWLPVSSATMRLTAKNLNAKSLNDEIFEGIKKDVDPEKLKKGKYKYVQVVNGQMRKVYTKKEVLMEFRNPVNDLFTNGYPVGELDLLMNIVAAHLNAEQYNRSIFTHGITSQGIINLKGEVDDEQLKAMRRSWYAQGVGSEAMFKTPIVNTPEGMEYIKLDTTHKDLEYSNYIEYLIKVMCAVYQIDPEEIGFTTGGRGGGSAGNSQNYNNVEKKVQYSKDKGLRPLLTFIENIINERILPLFSKELYKKYRFRFVGLRSEDRKVELDRIGKEGETYKTVNEIRKEMGYQPLEGADFVLNPIYMEWYMQMSPAGAEFQQKQTEQMQEQAGAAGGGSQDVQYVDEEGNPINPEDIDPDSMEFTDEDGNTVDHEGNVSQPETIAAKQEEKLPFEESQSELPFEEDKDKLPFE